MQKLGDAGLLSRVRCATLSLASVDSFSLWFWLGFRRSLRTFLVCDVLVTYQVLAFIFAIVLAAWTGPLIDRIQPGFAAGQVFKQNVISLAVMAGGDDIPSPREQLILDRRHWGTLNLTP